MQLLLVSFVCLFWPVVPLSLECWVNIKWSDSFELTLRHAWYPLEKMMGKIITKKVQYQWTAQKVLAYGEGELDVDDLTNIMEKNMLNVVRTKAHLWLRSTAKFTSASTELRHNTVTKKLHISSQNYNLCQRQVEYPTCDCTTMRVQPTFGFKWHIFSVTAYLVHSLIKTMMFSGVRREESDDPFSTKSRSMHRSPCCVQFWVPKSGKEVT